MSDDDLSLDNNLKPERQRGVDQTLKIRVHQALMKSLDLKLVEELSPEGLRRELYTLVRDILGLEKIQVKEQQFESLVSSIYDEILGLGPIQPLMLDPQVSDILVNGPEMVYVERYGQLESTDIRFNGTEHLVSIIERIVSKVGRRIDESSPMVDARLPDGSRVNAIIPPLSIDGPMLSIRRFSHKPMSIDDLVRLGSLSGAMAQVLAALVKSRINFVISGGTGSGKTTLLNVLSGFISPKERIITIEDAAELRLQQPHVVRLETRPPNIEGRGEINQRALVRNSLRMRPDRIIIGEVRGAEVLDMLQAMNTGHEGSMTTVHANSGRDALIRLENMVELSGQGLGLRPVRQQIVSALSVVIQIARLTDGRRRVVSVQEITGLQGDVIEMQEILSFQQTGVAADGTVRGEFVPTGVRPRFMDRLTLRGFTLPNSLFGPTEILAIDDSRAA
jgi:pilus assembly protein CpaF